MDSRSRSLHFIVRFQKPAVPETKWIKGNKSADKIDKKTDKSILAPSQPLQTNTNREVQGSLTADKEKQCSSEAEHEMQLKFIGNNESNKNSTLIAEVMTKMLLMVSLNNSEFKKKAMTFRVGKYDNMMQTKSERFLLHLKLSGKNENVFLLLCDTNSLIAERYLFYQNCHCQTKFLKESFYRKVTG